MARSNNFLSIILLVCVQYLVQDVTAHETGHVTYKPQQLFTTTVKPNLNNWLKPRSMTTMKPNPNWLIKETTMKPDSNNWLIKTTMKPFWLTKPTTRKPWIWFTRPNLDWLLNQRPTTTMSPNWDYASTNSLPSFVYTLAIVIPVLMVVSIAYTCYKQQQNKLSTATVQRPQAPVFVMTTPSSAENSTANPADRNQPSIFAMVSPTPSENEQYPEDLPPPYPNESPPSYDQIKPSAPFHEAVHDKPIHFRKFSL